MGLVAWLFLPTFAQASWYSYTVRHDNAECSAQSSYLGVYLTPALCAPAAGAIGCTTFMFSSSYTSWGCRCCSQPDPRKDHSLWDVYTVVDCDQPGAECVTPASLLVQGALAAERFCADAVPESHAAEYESAASDLNDVLAAWEDYLAVDDSGSFALAASNASSIAAAVLAPAADGSACSSRASACNKGGVLLQQLRSLLALQDGTAARAFADAPSHRVLFDTHKVLVADGLWLNAASMEGVLSFFDHLPPLLMSEGVLKDAPFATMTVRDAFKCDGVHEATSLGVTAREFNVFQNQRGCCMEDAFGGTPFTFYGDLLMTVVRHEAAHQFDRVVAADPALYAMKEAYRAAATDDLDWLRSSVGNAYFQSAPQEIIASQVGNQYLLSSSNQLKLALSRLADGTSSLPLRWFLFHLELFARHPEGCSDRHCRTQTLLYHSGVEPSSDAAAMTTTYCAELGRNGAAQIASLRLPGCAPLNVTYASETRRAGDS